MVNILESVELDNVVGYIDFYISPGQHIKSVDLDSAVGPPSCTQHHVLAPMWHPPTIKVFTWTGKLVQRLELSDLGLHDHCRSISPVHEGKLNVWVKMSGNMTISHKVITYEIEDEDEEDDEEEEDEEDDAEVNMDKNKQ